MPRWSIRLCRLFGIQLSVHVTFFLLLAYVAWEGWEDAVAQNTPGPLGSLIASVYLLVFFACVVLHELGHALTAKRFGVGVPRILLLPIGGMAEFDSIPRQPGRELAITIAGPAVNFAIVGVLLLFVAFPGGGMVAVLQEFFGGEAAEAGLETAGWSFIQEFAANLMIMNLIMGCFNLIPVFPMDGGRVLRALLATRLPYCKVTFVAATLGKFLAAGGMLTAVFVLQPAQPQLAVLFVFILFAGEMEYRMVRRRELEEERWRQQLAQFCAVEPLPPPLPPAHQGRTQVF